MNVRSPWNTEQWQTGRLEFNLINCPQGLVFSVPSPVSPGLLSNFSEDDRCKSRLNHRFFITTTTSHRLKLCNLILFFLDPSSMKLFTLPLDYLYLPYCLNLFSGRPLMDIILLCTISSSHKWYWQSIFPYYTKLLPLSKMCVMELVHWFDS